MLLIFPPVAKPSEPPAGIAKLAGALASHGHACETADLSLEGLLFLLGIELHASDTWGKRAIKDRQRNLAALRDPRTYLSRDKYSRAVMDLSRALELAGRERGATVGLADYHDAALSPVRSADLVAAARHPERNVFHPFFSRRLPELLEKAFLPQRRPRLDHSRTGCGREEEQENPGNGGNGLVGFSLNYLSQALTTFAMIGFIRQTYPRARIVLGGGLVTSWMKRPGWKDPFQGLVDHLIAGPGEGQLLSLLGTSARRPFVPDYTGLSPDRYLSAGIVLPYAASSGCFWNKCSFCPEPAEGNPYVPVPAQQATAELHSLIAATNPSLVHLLDNAVSSALLHALADAPLGVPWYGFARISAELADPDFCMALKGSGCVMLKLGLESGDQSELDKLEKGIDLGTASRVLANLHQAGIATYVYLLFGTPVETITEARHTLDFVAQHKQAITFLNLALFNMPLCSPDAARYPTGDFYAGDLSLYRDFRHPHGWDRREVRRFLEEEFKRHPAVAAILRNDPPVFTSNHAPFFSGSKIT